ncbi:MAG: DUF1653 domain-containing protein [Selenomonadales bacterium]|nr:DUF1653 domain-containing protein [Selenomonadales bacterium]MBQ2113642.1 DUF1653 domain-containing protein [Selenomonadales bacterium]MBQ5588193.1 DUF1653 domain-containing protein [Selenomonadales bacterium]MBQ5859652.1 DUF1653 domain-containing protein [Selenomonadales bacterium]MBR0324862.1 DUF1653 domain-containing protein [Selenomonadales bacterium]
MTELKAGRYRHFKGKEYEVITVAKDSETLEDMVVYRALYGEYGYWVRPLTMFCETVTVEGQTMPRFQYIGVK